MKICLTIPTKLLIVVLILTLISPVNIHAQEGAGITIIPPKFELFGNPGDIITETIRVKNVSTTPQAFAILVEDFSSTGEKGNVVLEEGESDSAYSLKRWIELSSENLVIQPDQEIQFPFSINIPSDADPGGHYASILFQIGSAQQTPGVASVQHRVGSLVLLRVSGNVVEDAVIESFSVPKYLQRSPVKFGLRIKNNGTTHIRPSGTIILTNLFGKKVDEIPLNSQNVFPGAIRIMDTEYTRDNMFGYYTATLVATYGQQNLPLTAASKFLVASPTTLALLIVGVLAAFVFLISVISGRKRLAKAAKILASGDK